VTGYGFEGQETRVRFPAELRNFSVLHSIQTGPKVHSLCYPMDIESVSSAVKRQRRKAGHLLSSSADVKNAWMYTSTPLYVFQARCLIKYRDKFTFTQSRIITIL
jgi:hypothetical protein